MGANRYGKDGIRLVLVRRDGTRHSVRDLTVDVRLEGDFAEVYTDGDNSSVLPTDTMRSTVYALAQRELTGSIEDFAAALARRFLAATPRADVAEVQIAEHPWKRAEGSSPQGHDHAFTRSGDERWTTVVRSARDGTAEVTSGLAGLLVLKTTGSAFSGFRRDDYTVLAETDDRIMATEVTCSWTWSSAYPDARRDPDATRSVVRRTLVGCFGDHDESRSVQHTLHAMGEATLAAVPELASVSLLLPNRHHVRVDLSAFGIDNDDAVFVATDRPYGVIEGTVTRG